VGNRSFCEHGGNCLMPLMTVPALATAVDEALTIVKDERRLAAMRSGAEATVAEHSLLKEREAFYALVDNLDQIW
jgi:hypothetical protein